MKTVYPCRYPQCWRIAIYFAIDNVPQYGHVCCSCLCLVPSKERAHYKRAK